MLDLDANKWKRKQHEHETKKKSPIQILCIQPQITQVQYVSVIILKYIVLEFYNSN